ncbi:GNAT family N-acetyltransferase [uncultured Tistrella sp.]|uniref:GNAT family N-acetyltransferase n=1 Tax=Tistrella mobilis TaxID=171437 RepID=UPI000C097527|nr:GNAT family N-acetyltransferase [uncultured Tistrella sp.]MAM76320.1 GNAT family N-acetyltransferase [Tistrella sp.]
MIRAGWRPLTAADLDRLNEIADAVHLDFPERAEVPAERLHLFPAGCFAAIADGRMVGYAVTHPWIDGHPPALDSLLGAIPGDADCLYIHDVALLPEVRGQGLARQLVAMLDGLARDQGLPRLALTAVGGSAPGWAAMGFRARDVDPASPLAAKLASYEADARYMTREPDSHG